MRYMIFLGILVLLISGCSMEELRKMQDENPIIIENPELIKTERRWFPEEADIRLNISGEVEVKSYLGLRLDNLSDIPLEENAVEIDEESYLLEITGKVEKPFSISYEDIQFTLPRTSKTEERHYLDGNWIIAKWTGVLFQELLNRAQGEIENAKYATFYSADGTKTQLPISYLLGEQIILAYKINDITLTSGRGFPLILVAEDKWNYKWSKWITKIEITDEEVLGDMELKGYDNYASIDFPAK